MVTHHPPGLNPCLQHSWRIDASPARLPLNAYHTKPHPRPATLGWLLTSYAACGPMKHRRIASRIFVALVGIALAAFVVAHAIDYFLFSGNCDRLEAKARDPQVQTALRAWASKNWTGKPVSGADYRDNDGIGPGGRWVPATFDGSILSMGERAHVRLMGPSPVDIRDDNISAKVRAIGFFERSRYGVVVQLPDRPEYSERPRSVRWLSDSIGVVCMQ